ncbi:hypothetical protein SCP_0305870 [Sparassis crispa]|uniref:Major facilitator superfamily (MFS) profile domain-containing protein n=1 Tax=Sparassis crispa TaxID=139825 RepID=A0A401GFA4_9APHY|nr:hypothetical protein SCP_0305870 [Sparassis crispa]GBE80867.1 hypothetical protein SCP_0305870 [Sparassis crispa]
MSRSCVNEYDVEPAPALMPTGASTPTMPSISDALAMSNLPTTEPNEPRVPNRSETLSLTDQTNLVPFKKVITVFSGLSLCILVSCLDSTIVATALPTISDAFDAGAIVSWVPSGYLLTSTAFQPLCEQIRCSLNPRS